MMPVIPVEQRSIVFEAPYRVTVQRRPGPAVRPGKVLVKARFSAISAGTELLVYRGQLPGDMAVDAQIAGLSEPPSYPMPYGYSVVGHVCACGAGVDAGWLGKRVFAFHPHTSVFALHPDVLVELPPLTTDEDALFLANMETAIGLVLDSRPLIGERVLVVGQGVVGLLVASLLLKYPLLQVDTTDLNPRRLYKSKILGPVRIYDPASIPHDDYDLVYELSGNPDGLKTALRHAGASGRVVIGSWYGTKEAVLDLGGRFHRSKLTLYSSQVSDIDPSLKGRWTKRRRLNLAVASLSEIAPRRFITHEFDLDHAHQAYALLDASHPDVLQVIFRYSSY